MDTFSNFLVVRASLANLKESAVALNESFADINYQKGLNFNWNRNTGSYSKTSVKKGIYKMRKILATPEHVTVEFDFSYVAGDEKGGYGDNAFASVRRILDGFRQNGGFDFNGYQNTPESLKFHGVQHQIGLSPMKPTKLPTNSYTVDIKIKKGGSAGTTWEDEPLGDMYTATLDLKLA